MMKFHNNSNGVRRFFLATLCSLALITLLLASNAFGQKASVVSWSAQVEPAKVKADGRAKVRVNARIQAGWHLYSLTQGEPLIATKVTLTEDGNFKVAGAASQPKPKTAYDPNLQLDTQTFEGDVAFIIPIKIKPNAHTGKQQIAL